MTPASFARLARVLHDGTGLAVEPSKQYLLEARLRPLLRQYGLADLDALAARLDDELARAVNDAMTTSETMFFRDTTPFEHVRLCALPRLHAARPPGARLRVWSAAASTGQEAYSLAMIIADLGPRLLGREVEIIGTDVSRAQLERATAGAYRAFEMDRGLPAALRARHFHREASVWRISPKLRAQVIFQEANLLDDLRPLGMFDVIFCRNVLIFFDLPTKQLVLARVAQQLAPDGYLYLGGAEAMLGRNEWLIPVGDEHGVFQRAA